MNLFSEIGLFWKRKTMETLRQPIWVIPGLVAPLLYILLFSPLLRNIGCPPRTTAEVLSGFVPGILTLLAFSTGQGSGWIVIWELRGGVIERLRVTPARWFSIAVSRQSVDVRFRDFAFGAKM